MAKKCYNFYYGYGIDCKRIGELNKMNDNKKYIYNPKQAKFYINNGMKVLDTGIHNKTKKVFWVFDFNETKEVYVEWVNRQYHNKHIC